MESTHELIIPNEGFPFKMFLFEGMNGNYVRENHWHRSIEIFAVMEGELTFIMNEKDIPLHSGEFIIVNSYEVHSIHSPNPNQTLVVQIPLHVLKAYHTATEYIRFSYDVKQKDAQMVELLHDIYLTYDGKQEGYDMLVNSRFYMLLYWMISRYRDKIADPDLVQINKNLGKLSEITEYMKANYQNELSLESLADRFGYSPAYLSRMFRKYAKINYKSYLQNIRLQYAYQELIHTEHPILEIALNNGFPNSKAFSGLFRETYHMLPKDYRQWMKTNR